MKTPKTINRILRSQEPASAAPMPRSWRCQFCGRRFTDRTQLLEHLKATRRLSLAEEFAGVSLYRSE